MSTPARTASAAEQLAATLPVPGLRVSGQLTGSPAPMAAAVVSASLIGPAAAELVLALADTGFVAEAGGGPAARTTAVLRPALERAAAALGDGVLSELVEGDPAGLLSGAPGVAVFEISDGAAPFGWFAVRLTEPAGQGEDPGTFADRLGRIQDVEMALTVEIGRTRMSIREALAMEPGKIIELDRSAGAPVDVLLNGRRIALGEIVVVDQDYAVRISRILDTADAQR
ncbi:flagellar motor switch protein FliN [Sinomonas sp. RB5]